MQKINRLESFRCAFAGIWYTVRTQRNAQIHLIVTVIVSAIGLMVKLTFLEWAIIALTVGLVMVAETLNTAAEAAMDYASPEFHPEVKIVKDVAAGAVLIAAIISVIVGLLILGPPIWQYFT